MNANECKDCEKTADDDDGHKTQKEHSTIVIYSPHLGHAIVRVGQEICLDDRMSIWNK